MSILDIECVLYGDRVTHIIIPDGSIEISIREAIIVDFVPFLSLPKVEREITECLHLILRTDIRDRTEWSWDDILISIDTDDFFCDVFFD